MRYSAFIPERAFATSAAVLFFSVRAIIGADGATTQEDHLDLNLANLYAGARVVYVSSGPIAFAGRMIDDDVRTTFRFRGSDSHPTAIVQLAANQPVVRISVVLKTKAARLDVYLTNKLSGDLVDLKSIACIVDVPADREVTFDLAAGAARYLALRWTVEKPLQEAFEVAEISAFGATPVARLDLDQIKPSLAEASTHLPGQSRPDFSNELGTLADPPTIAPASP